MGKPPRSTLLTSATVKSRHDPAGSRLQRRGAGNGRRRPAGRSGTVVAGAALGVDGAGEAGIGAAPPREGWAAGSRPVGSHAGACRWPAGAGSHGPWPPSRTAGHWVGANECLADLRVLG